MKAGSPDLATLGHRIRHFRGERGLTLDQLGDAIGLAGSQLSLIENGKREPKLSTLDALASALEVGLPDLLAREAPSRRAALELELGRAQSSPIYARLGLPAI
ncbi:MAG TPA: helix-turn-helix transcriptional regulator, partial [Agromyces sp.]